MVNRKILITGASGQSGRQVTRALQAAGVRFRVGQHSLSLNPSLETVRLDFLDPLSWTPALLGCDGVYLVRPPAIARMKNTLCAFIDRAVELNVKQVVFLSVAGAEKLSFLPHRRVERHLELSDLEWTILRADFFCQNLGSAYRNEIRELDRVMVPAGKAKIAFLDLYDVGEIAATIFQNPSQHSGRAYHLTGPEALSFPEVCNTLSNLLGREISYHDCGVLEYVLKLRENSLPWLQIFVQTLLHLGLRFGQSSQVSGDVEQILHRPGCTIEDYLERNNALWSSQ